MRRWSHRGRAAGVISYVDKDQVFRFANKTYETWFDRPRSAIVGRRVDEVMTHAMYEARRPHLERALAGEQVSYEVEFPRSAGVAFTEVVHVPHRDASGRVFGVYVIVAGITQRKLAERKIAESEARFRAIANSAPVPMWVTGPDGLREFVNQAYVDFFGGSYEDALAFDWRKALHPDDLSRIPGGTRNQLVGEDDHRGGPLLARRRPVAVVARQIAASAGPGGGGEHVGFIGVAHDVTDAKRAQHDLALINETLEKRVAERTAQLAASEALVQTFFQHSPECHAVRMQAGLAIRRSILRPSVSTERREKRWSVGRRRRSSTRKRGMRSTGISGRAFERAERIATSEPTAHPRSRRLRPQSQYARAKRAGSS